MDFHTAAGIPAAGVQRVKEDYTWSGQPSSANVELHQAVVEENPK